MNTRTLISNYVPASWSGWSVLRSAFARAAASLPFIVLLWAESVCICVVNAQQPDTHIDPLHGIIRTAVHDTTRLAALMALSEAIYMVDPDSNLTICKNAWNEVEQLLANPRLNPQERKSLHRSGATALNNKAVSHFIFGELDSAMSLFKRAETIHTKHGFIARAADALNNQGLIHGIRGDYKEQRRSLFAALTIYQRAGDAINSANALVNIGNYQRERGAADSALVYFRRALDIFEDKGDKQGIANGKLNLGQALVEQGRQADGLEALLEAEALYVEVGDQRGLAVCLNNIGSLQMNLGLSTESLAYLHRALDINTTLGAVNESATLHMNIGSLLERQGQLDLARTNFQHSLELYEQTGDLSGASIAQGHLGDLMKNTGDLKGARTHFEAAVQLAQRTDRPHDLANALYKLGHFLEDQNALDEALALYRQGLELDRQSGDRASGSYSLFSIAGILNKQGKYREATTFARKALEVAREVGYPASIQRAARVLHEALVAQRQWPEATAMLKLHYQMKDSAESADQAKQVLRAQLHYVFEKKHLADSLSHALRVEEVEHERTLATLKSKQARNRSLGIGGGALFLLAGGGLYYRLDRKRRHERHERRAAELQMRLLRAQMNPHFLFNALHSLHAYIQNNDKELASGFLSKFTRLMRLVLEHSQHSEITLSEDLEALRLYLDLEQVRMSGKFDHTITVDPGLDPETTFVPPLVLQPFVENAIWHGLTQKEGRGHIAVSVQRSGDQILISVEDDGVGRAAAATNGTEQSGKTSLGTSITQERLALLGARHGAEAGFRYRNVDQGTLVEVFLPLLSEH